MATFLAKIQHPWAWIGAFVRLRFQSWWQARTAPADQIKLTQSNIYILPTGSGLMLAMTLLILLITSINYQLSLGYALTFLLAGSAIVGMHIGHATLRGLTLSLAAPKAQYAGSAVQIEVQLQNPGKTIRYALALSVDADLASGHALPAQPATKPAKAAAWTDLAAHGSSTLALRFVATQRGLQRLPSLRIETRFPLGSFRVWAHWRPAAQVLIYPQPEANPPALPLAQTGQEERRGKALAADPSQQEFDSIRSYRRGDALKHVVWKKAAKADAEGNGLVVRDTQPSGQNQLCLDLAHTGLADKELSLQRLTAWVLAAQALGLGYGLRLPGQEIAADSGPDQQRRCLEALALC